MDVPVERNPLGNFQLYQYEYPFLKNENHVAGAPLNVLTDWTANGGYGGNTRWRPFTNISNYYWMYAYSPIDGLPSVAFELNREIYLACIRVARGGGARMIKEGSTAQIFYMENESWFPCSDKMVLPDSPEPLWTNIETHHTNFRIVYDDGTAPFKNGTRGVYAPVEIFEWR